MNDFTVCQLQVQAGVAKNFAYHIYLSNKLVHIAFARNLVSYNPAYIYAEF